MISLAVIQVDLQRGRFGHPAALMETLVDRSVLQHTIDRVARIDGLDEIVLLHPEAQSLEGCYVEPSGGPAITTQAMAVRPGDGWLSGLIDSGRKWSLTAWRGGIGGMTVYDELLPAYPLWRAMQSRGAESLLALRGDWCAIDPALAARQLELHRSAPEAMKLTFTQAPPGLSPMVIHASVLEELVEHTALIANLLCYNPTKPVIDPMGKDVNVPVSASVRDQYRRMIYDTPRAIDHLRLIAERLGDRFADADAVTITEASRAVEQDQPWRSFDRLPQQLNVELSPRRTPMGPIVPQHRLDLNRSDMTPATIDALFDAVRPAGNDADAARSDTAMIFGGLGDPILHEAWFETLERAIHSDDLLGVGIETDLLVDDETIDRLATLPLDVISVRLNADSAETYATLMGVDAFGRVMDNLQRLFKRRNANRQAGAGFCGWVVPRLVKVAENLGDLETFFERWMTLAGWAVVDRAATGRGLIPDLSPVPMDVPWPADKPIDLHRRKQRLTVLSDGTVCLCGQDWLGRLPVGALGGDKSLVEGWRSVVALADASGAADAVCPSCWRWLMAQRRLFTAAEPVAVEGGV